MNPAFLPPELTADRRPRLLVVDDEPLNVQALYQVFAADCQVLVATDGPGALQRCLQALPDRKSTRLNSSHSQQSRMPSSA